MYCDVICPLGEVHSALEKRDALRELKNGVEGSTVYIGDSYNDILPLLDADIGILFCPKERTTKFCEAFHIGLYPINDTSYQQQHTNNLFLWVAQSWTQIAQFVDRTNNGDA